MRKPIKDLKQYQKKELCEVFDNRIIPEARKSILVFTKYTKDDYQVNWHHRLLSGYLTDFAFGRIKRLMIFAPPRHGKSELVSRRLPAFIHGINNNAEIMAASYNAGLASDMTADVQRVMDQPEYKILFPNSIITEPNKSTQWARNSTEHELLPLADGTQLKGKYRGQGVGGTFTGRGATHIIIDDPIKGREAADSITFRNKLWSWYNSDLRSRLEKDGSILITLTRWHQDDLAGRLIELSKTDPEADQWTIISLPAILDTVENDYDKRKLGEPLWPEKYDIAALTGIKAQSSSDWNALYQQRPSAVEGGLVKRGWIKFYKALPEIHDQIISADLTFKDAKNSDFVCIQVWGRIGANKYLIDQIRDRLDFPATIQAFRQMASRYPKATLKLVEDKANGPALIASLKKELTGIVPENPEGSKSARLSAVSPEFESGNVYYPDPSIAPWVHVNISELCDFPNAAHDDTVDTTTQALKRFREREGIAFTKEMVQTKGTTIISGARGKSQW